MNSRMQSKSFVIKNRWKTYLFWWVCFICINVGSFVFTTISSVFGLILLALPVIGVITTIMDRNTQIVFDDKGITLSDGVMCKWGNVKHLEFKGIWPSLKLIIQTNSENYIEDTALYVFNFEKLKLYMLENHPNVPCD